MSESNRPDGRKRTRIKKPENKVVLGLFFLFWAAILIMLFALFVGEMEMYNELQTQLARERANVEAALTEQESLEIELTFFDSDSYLEQLARERLGMARPNEIVFRNIAE
ncbi:MAG: septum formation initiator family protein [Defluviitaleaceae bacterium]|nr:septum formation initiator family protein [Defluviitaleaceae bacterium]